MTNPCVGGCGRTVQAPYIRCASCTIDCLERLADRFQEAARDIAQPKRVADPNVLALSANDKTWLKACGIATT